MHKHILYSISEHVEPLLDDFVVCDEEGEVLSTQGDATEYSHTLPVLVNEHQIGVLETADDLDEWKTTALQAIIDETAARIENAFDTVDDQSQDFIWKRLLKGDLTPFQEQAAKETYSLSEFKSFGLMLFKAESRATVSERFEEDLRMLLEKYISEKISYTFFRFGARETAIVFEISESKNLSYEEVKKVFYQYRKHILKGIEKYGVVSSGKCVLVLGEEDVFLEELHEAYTQLKTFARNTLRVSEKSRVTLFDHNPLLLLLQHIPAEQARAFISATVQDVEDEDIRDMIIAYVNNGFTATQAAEEIGVHRHTLNNRIEEFLTSTPDSHQRFQEVMGYYIAFLLEDLY